MSIFYQYNATRMYKTLPSCPVFYIAEKIEKTSTLVIKPKEGSFWLKLASSFLSTEAAF